MAGSYPDVPGYRFAYDKDGTTILLSKGDNTGAPVFMPLQYSPTPATLLNKSMGTGVVYATNYWLAWPSGHYMTFFFPENRNITGYYINIGNASGVNPSFNKIQTSSDATTPLDGTWTTLIDPYVYTQGGGDMSPDYRTNIQSVNWQNIYCLKICMGDQPRAIHLYGSIATTESPDRLRIVDMSGDDIAAQFDYGDIRQRNNSTKQFRVVNNSSTKIANNITITMDTNPNASPSLIGQYQLSTDNVAFANAINIGNLNPGQSSGTLYLRDTIANNAQLGPWSVRLTASANTWS